MDPEIRSNEGGVQAPAGTGPCPRPSPCPPQLLPAEGSAAQEENKWSKLIPAGYKVKTGASLKAPTEMFRRIVHSDHNRGLESPFSPSFLPAVGPSPLQTSSPGVQTGFTPKLLCSPVRMSPGSPLLYSRFVFSPCLLVPISSPAKFWFKLEEPNSPEWSSSPQMVPVHQSTNLIFRRASQPYSRQLTLTSGTRQQTEGHQRTNVAPVEVKPRENVTIKRRKQLQVPPGPSLDEDLLAERVFEDYMTIMESVCPEIQEDVAAEEDEASGEPEMKNESLLDELCSDGDFVRNVGSILDMDFLDSLDLSALEEHEERSRPNTESLESLLPSNLEPEDLILLENIGKEMLETNLPELLRPPSTAEETSAAASSVKATDIQGQTFPLLQEHLNPVSAWCLVCCWSCFFMDDSFASSGPDTSQVSDSEDYDAAPGDASAFRWLPSPRFSQERPPAGVSESPSSFRESPTSQRESEPELKPEKQSGQQVCQELSSPELRSGVEGQRRGQTLEKCEERGSSRLQNPKAQRPKSTQETQNTTTPETETSDLRANKSERQRDKRLNEPSTDEVGTEEDVSRSSPKKKHKVERCGCRLRSTSRRRTRQ